MDLAELGISVRSDGVLTASDRLQKMERQSKRTETASARLARQAKAMGRAMRQAGKFAAVGFTAMAGASALAVRELNKVTATADAIGKASKNFDIAASALQEFRGAAELSGISTADFDGALRRFNRRIGLFVQTGSGAATKTIEKLGLEFQDAQGHLMGTEESLNIAIDAISKLPTAAEQAAAASQLFGEDAGPRMVALLSQGTAGVERLRQKVRETGSVMSDEAVKAAEDYKDATFLLGKQIDGLRQTLALALLPTAIDLVGVFSDLSLETSKTGDESDGLAESMRPLGALVLRLAQGAVLAAEGFSTLGKFLAATAATAVEVSDVLSFDLEWSDLYIPGKILGKMGKQAKKAGEDFDNLQGKISAIWDAAGEDIEQARSKTQSLFDQLGEGVKFFEMGSLAVRESVKTLDEYNAELQEQVDAIVKRNKALESSAMDEEVEAAKEAAEAAADYRKELEDLSDELDGPQAQAQRKFARSVQDAAARLASGQIAQETYNKAIGLYTQELAKASEEMETFDGWLDSIANRMTESQRAAQDYADSFISIADNVIYAATGMRMFGDEMDRATGSMDRSGSGGLARELASAISATEGRGLGESIGSSLRAYGTAGIAEGLQGALEDGLSQVTDDLTDGELQGYSVALGEAIAGNTGAAIGSALGTAVGAAFGGGLGASIGAAIGGAVGGLFDGEDDPYFVFGGSGSRGPSYLESFETYMGDVQARLRHMEAGAEDDLRQTFRDFDKTLASVITDDDLLADAKDALEGWDFVGHEEGNSVEALLRSRLDAVLGAFDNFTASIVRKGYDVEEQMNRLASAMIIDREVTLGRGLGLAGAGFDPGDISRPPGSGGPIGGGTDPISGVVIGKQSAEQIQAFSAAIEGTGDAADVTNPALAHTLQVVDELSKPSETLAETFDRLRNITASLDTGLALVGRGFEGSREDLIRFGDELQSVFGEGLEDALDTIYSTFFSDQERAGVRAQQARAQAASLLERAGIDVDADMLTLEGFRALWDDLFLTLGADNQALLIEAGVHISDLIDAEEGLSSAREESAREAKAAMDAVMSDLRGLEWSPLRRELYDINRATRDATSAVREAGGSQQDYSLIMRRHNLQIQALSATLRASLTDLREQLFGGDGVGQGMQQTASQVGSAMQDIRASMIDAIKGVQDWLDSSLLGSDSPLMPKEQLDAAGSQFWDAIDAARSGDAGAASDLPQLADQFLGQAGSFLGTSTAEYGDIWDMVRDAMQGVADMDVGPDPRGNPTYGQQQSIVSATEGTELSALEQARMASQMVDEIGVLSRISGDSPADIAREFDIPMARLIEAVTGKMPEATGDALSGYFNELVTETDEQLSALGRIEGVLGNIHSAISGLGEYGPFATPRDGGFSDAPIPGPIGPQPESRKSDPEQIAALGKIEARLARMEELAESGEDIGREQVAAIRQGTNATVPRLTEIVTETRQASRRPREDRIRA